MESRPLDNFKQPNQPPAESWIAKLVHKLKNNKLIILIIVIILIIGSLFILLLTKPSSNSQNKKVSTASNNKPKISSIASYPQTNLNCSNSISIMPLTLDFSITDLNCYEANNPSVLADSCDGTITQINLVSINCYLPPQYSYNNQLVCNGQAGSVSATGNLPLSYTCYVPTIANTIIYNCTGNILNYAATAINYTLSVSCSP